MSWIVFGLVILSASLFWQLRVHRWWRFEYLNRLRERRKEMAELDRDSLFWMAESDRELDGRNSAQREAKRFKDLWDQSQKALVDEGNIIVNLTLERDDLLEDLRKAHQDQAEALEQVNELMREVFSAIDDRHGKLLIFLDDIEKRQSEIKQRRKDNTDEQ
jgi:hypothetical protein